MSEENIAPIKAICSECGGLRLCEVMAYYKERGQDGYLDWCKEWFVLSCRGCEHTFMYSSSTNSEDYRDFYDEEGQALTEYIETKEYWPPVLKRKKPDWFKDYYIEGVKSEKLFDIMSELYNAFNQDLRALAAIGVRTAIDISSEIMGIPSEKKFVQKLDLLEEGEFIGQDEKEALGILLEAGNASAHRGWTPTFQQLESMLDALEYFIFMSFVVPYRKEGIVKNVENMRGEVPRKSKKK